METRNIWNPESWVSFILARSKSHWEEPICIVNTRRSPPVDNMPPWCSKKVYKLHAYLTTCGTSSYACVFSVFMNQSISRMDS